MNTRSAVFGRVVTRVSSVGNAEEAREMPSDPPDGIGRDRTGRSEMPRTDGPAEPGKPMV
jgi:hypothetical protein